jgi:uncharacterized protein (DUF1800 family)
MQSKPNNQGKMTWFWYHFTVDFHTVRSAPFSNAEVIHVVYSYMKMFLDNPLGNYKHSFEKMATQPAMMYYLNNQANSKPLLMRICSEIMELFTLEKTH